MVWAGLHRRAEWRGAFLALAFVALLLKIATPPGFMIAAPGSGAGFPLVICTGHGPLTTQTPGEKGDHHKSQSDAPCAFAGHAATPASEFSTPIVSASAFQVAELQLPRPDLTPGRGLAAPPPPSQGPPTLL